MSISVGRLVAELGIDLSDLEAGLLEGAREIEAFAANAQREFSALNTSDLRAVGVAGGRELVVGVDQGLKELRNASKDIPLLIDPSGLKAQGEEAAATLLQGLLGGFRQAGGAGSEAASAALVSGIVGSPARAEFAAQGAAAAAAFDNAIVAGVGKLAALNIIPASLPATLGSQLKAAGVLGGQQLGVGIEQGLAPVARQLASEGAAAGRAFTAGARTGLGPIDASFASATRSASSFGRSVGAGTNELTALSRRGGPAIIATAFAFESLGRSTQEGESGIRAAVRAISTLSFVAGPEVGIAVTTVGAAVDGILEHFGRLARETEKRRVEFKKSVDDLVNTANISGLESKLRDIKIGLPSQGLNQLTGFAPGSLNDLRKQFAQNEQAIAEATRQRNVFIIGDLTAKQAELRAKILPLQAEERQLIASILNPPTVPRDVTGAPKITITAKPDLQSLQDSVKQLTAAAQFATTPALRVAGVATGLAHAYDLATIALSKQNDQLGETATALRDVIGELLKTPAVQVLRFEAVPLPPLTPLIQKVKLEPLERIDIPVKAQLGLANVFTIPGSSVGAVHSITKDLEGFANIARGITDAADALGILGDHARQSLRGVTDLLGGLAAIQKARIDPKNINVFGEITGGIAALGGTVSAIVGAVGLIQDAFRNGAADMRESIIAGNKDVIIALRLAAEGFRNTVAQQQAGSTAIRGLDPRFLDFLQHFPAFAAGTSSSLLDTALKGFHISLDELKAIAKQNNITLFDEKGRLVADAMNQLDAAIKLSIDAMTKFGDSLQDQVTITDLVNRANRPAGVAATGQQQISTQLGFLTPEIIRDFFKVTDVSTPGGLAAVRAEIQAFLAALKAGTVPIEDFGNRDKNDLVQIIGSVLDGFDAIANSADSLAKTADSATAALKNIPEGFKVERFRFNATMAELSDTLLKQATLPPNVIPISAAAAFGPDSLAAQAGLSGKALADSLTTGGKDIAQLLALGGKDVADALVSGARDIATQFVALARGSGSSTNVALSGRDMGEELATAFDKAQRSGGSEQAERELADQIATLSDRLAELTASVAAQQGVQMTFGDIVIDGGKSTSDQADDFIAEIKKRARSSGNEIVRQLALSLPVR
jgi:hypothetical protein